MKNQVHRQIRTIVAENVRHARSTADLTQRELAGLVNDVDKLAVYRWENGIALPNPENFAALADALGREVSWFYIDHSSEPRAAA